jgi:hypothetical protein
MLIQTRGLYSSVQRRSLNNFPACAFFATSAAAAARTASAAAAFAASLAATSDAFAALSQGLTLVHLLAYRGRF